MKTNINNICVSFYIFIIVALTGADGKKYRVRYTADEFGYHPVTELEEIDPIQ